MSLLNPKDLMKMEAARSHQDALSKQINNIGSRAPGGDFVLAKSLLSQIAFMSEGQSANYDFRPHLQKWGREVVKSNAIARELRKNPLQKTFPGVVQALGGAEAYEAVCKSIMDVGAVTDLAQVVGGQSLGVVSLDMSVARGTIRPKSFTLYNMLHKSVASQIVDFWPYASEIGGGPVGTAYSSFESQTNTVNYNQGSWDLKTLFLKLAVDGRAISMALGAQNSFVDIVEQEQANGALSVLSTINWALYWGNSLYYPNQIQGIAAQLYANNIFDFSGYYAPLASEISQQQALFNFIYEAAAKISNERTYGQITHALMGNFAIADVQSLVTTQIRNLAVGGFSDNDKIMVNGNLHGVRTRFGDIQFALDFFINARDIPLQALIYDNGTNTNQASASINPPTSVAWAVNASATGSAWTTAYAPSPNAYVYAVAMTDSIMNESDLTYTTVVSGLSAGGNVVLTITPNGSAGSNFRVFRSGLGYNQTSSQNPAAFRYIGTVAANGASPVTFTDLNTLIPGSDTIFLLDMDEQDNAIDYRFLLPLTRIDLFSQALYMPFAIAHIGALRLRVPKWHGMIKNYPSNNPTFNALLPNLNASASP